MFSDLEKVGDDAEKEKRQELLEAHAQLVADHYDAFNV